MKKILASTALLGLLSGCLYVPPHDHGGYPVYRDNSGYGREHGEERRDDRRDEGRSERRERGEEERGDRRERRER